MTRTISLALAALLATAGSASAQEPIGGTTEQFTALVRDDYAKFGKLVKDLNIKAE